MDHPLSPEEVKALRSNTTWEGNFYPLDSRQVQRLYETIDDRERERDEINRAGAAIITELQDLCDILRQERDELQRKLDAYQKLAAPVWPKPREYGSGL